MTKSRMNRRVVLCGSSVKVLAVPGRVAQTKWQDPGDSHHRWVGDSPAVRGAKESDERFRHFCATPRFELATLGEGRHVDNHWGKPVDQLLCEVKPDNTKGKKPPRCWGGMVGKIQEDG